MTKVFSGAATFLLLAIWLAPVLASLGDVFCWFFVGQQCSGISWNADRIGVMAFWTVLAPFVVLPLVEVLP